MNCVAVREELPEFAVGVLATRDRVAVERHLQWCSGCRKEAAELGEAAATFALALAPAPLPDDLGERVVARIHEAAGKPGSRRRLRTAAAVAVAAMVAVAGLGWGAVMAGRAERFAERAAQAERQRAAALEQFQGVLRILPFQAAATETHLGQLAPTLALGRGGGAVLQLVSPTQLDFVIVIVNGLPRNPALRPFRIALRNDAGREIGAGTIAELDADGGAEVFRQFVNTDLTGFTTVLVRDVSGQVVLEGTIDQRSSPA